MNAKEALNETQCWSRFQDGDVNAYQEIYERYFDRLFNYSFRVLQDAHDCQDLLQEYFTRLWVNRKSLPLPENTEAFLVSLLKLRVIDALRSRHIREKHILLYQSLRTDPGTEDASGALLFREEMKKFHHHLAQLPEQLRIVFCLYYFEARPVEEIARLSSKAPQTVRNQINQATTRLRMQLRGQFPTMLF